MLLGGYVFAVETNVTSVAKHRRIFDITDSFRVDRKYIKCYMRTSFKGQFSVHIKEENKMKIK